MQASTAFTHYLLLPLDCLSLVLFIALVFFLAGSADYAAADAALSLDVKLFSLAQLPIKITYCAV
jgi:hypothetical protein